MTEQSIIGARASVMLYNDNQKKWVPSGSSSGLSKVQIYHHQQNNTFRVVGRKLQDHEVVINCAILKGLKYNQATATFHQWRDSKLVYGLNFSSQQDAENFARAMMHALEVLSGRVSNQQIVGPPTNGNGYDEDMGYRTMTSEDAAILRQQQHITGQVTPSAQTPTSQTNQNNIPNSPPTPQGHHRTSRNSLSAPPAPQPQQIPVPQQQSQHNIYGQTPNVQNQNGIPHQQQQQISPAPIQQQQYHAPQQISQQISQQHSLYASQQIMNTGFQQTNQYPQQTFVISNSNPNLNIHQYIQQPTCVSQHTTTATHQTSQNNGPIYVSSQHQIPQGLSSSTSANSVVYASQQQIGTSLPTVQSAISNGPPVAMSNAFTQINNSQNQQQPQQQQVQENPYGQLPIAQQILPNVSSSNSSGPPLPPPINRMNSNCSTAVAPAAPPPPPSFVGYNAPASLSAPPIAPQPPIPPAPPAMPGAMAGPAAPPPPPPPPMAGLSAKKEDPQADLMGSLAAQLQQAKLKKNKSAITSASTESNSNNSNGNNGNYGTIGRSSNGMASMMDEMAKTLARRRAQAEKKEPEPDNEVKQRPWEKSNTLPHKLGNSNTNSNTSNSSNATGTGGESPRPMRKRFGSASEETILKQVNGDGLALAISSSDLDALKSEIVREMRAEIQKVKQEIIEVIKSEFNRR